MENYALFEDASVTRACMQVLTLYMDMSPSTNTCSKIYQKVCMYTLVLRGSHNYIM